jgi:hypothetical protein
MGNRPGFTILEAAVAMMVISLVSIATLGAFAADMRAATRAQQLVPAAALARERMGVMETANAQTLHMLPDSMTHGGFAAPYDRYRWTASAEPLRSEPSLVEIVVHVGWNEGSFSLRERRYRAPSRGMLRSVASTTR